MLDAGRRVRPVSTALLGDNLFTSHASPAVVLSATGVIMGRLGPHGLGGAWPRAYLNGALRLVRKGLRNAYFAIASTPRAIVAVWWLLAIAVVMTLMWIYS